MTASTIALLATLLAHPTNTARVRPQPALQKTVGVTLACYAWTAGEILPGKSVRACLNLMSGEVLGGVYTRKGREVCQLTGYFDGQCTTIAGCGDTSTSCR